MMTLTRRRSVIGVRMHSEHRMMSYRTSGGEGGGGGGGVSCYKSSVILCSSSSSGWSHQLTVLFLILTTFFACVGGKFGSPPVANDQQSSLVLLNYSGPQPSDKFIPCHFNPGCFCKYDQKTEIYDSLRRLWQLVGFNDTSFFRAVTALQREIRNDPTTTYFFPESDLSLLAQLVVNSSASLHSFTFQNHARPLEPGPVFEFVCLAVPMSVIPTEYSAHGMISHVSVTGSELGMLDGSAFAGLEVQNIQLSRDHLYFISEYAFSSMGNSLTVLDLSANFLDEIPFTAFKALKILEWLNLSNNLIHSITGDWFSVSESIRQLSLSGNSVDSLPKKLLPAFNRLVWLDLTSNFVRGNLTHDQFPPNLQTLILMKNRFQEIPTGVFHLKSLSWLILGGCTIATIPTDWPKGVAPLQMNQMDLTENFIQNWPSRPFGAQLTVLDLDVSKNYIQALPAGAFHSMNCFRLSLGYNRIQMIDPEAFSTLENSLQYLNLENNRMPGIPWHALHNLTSLMHLYVGSNHLSDETVGAPEVGKDCKLTYLGLNGNQLTRVPRRLLGRCSNLLHLNLGYNQIAHLDDLAILTSPVRTPSFAGGAMITTPSRRLRNLSTLVLRNNPIYSLAFSGTGNGGGGTPHHHHHAHGTNNNNNNNNNGQGGSGDQHQRKSSEFEGEGGGGGGGGIMDNSLEASGRDPYLQGTGGYSSYHVLPSIPNVFRTEAFPNLYELSLSFCQLSGDLEPFPSLQLTNLEISMGLKSATTIRPAMFQQLRNLEWLALDHNSLQSVSDYSFYSNRNLTYVNLEWNRIETLPRQMFHPDIHQSISQVRLSHNKIQSILSESFLSFPAINLDLSYNSIQAVERHAFSIALPGGQPIPSGVLGPPGTLPIQPSGGGGSVSKGNAAILALENELTSMSPNDAGYFTAAAQTGSSSSSSSSGASGTSPPTSVSAALAFSSTRPGLNLYMNQNRLTMMKPNALAGEKFSLVDLSYNQLVVFNFDTFARRTLLGGLNISHNSIERLVVPKNRRIVLKFLDVSFNRIQFRGGVGALVSLCPSVLLDMSHNRLERIDSKLFPTNCSLREVKLEANYITSLDPESFTNLRDLTVLHLANNQISFVPEILFIRNSKLNYLDLSRNKIRSLPRDALVGSNIENLKLGTNQFVNLPVGALSQVSRRLRRLDMSHNAVEHLDSTMFESIAGLVHLNLSYNRLTILPDNAFANLASLRELDLSHNMLRANFKELFHFLPKLKLLRLSNCGIKALPLMPLPHLISLDLSWNGMEEIRMQSLSSLGRLRVLDLSNNELTSSKIPSWTHLANLVTLRISSNPLKSLTKDTFHGLKRLETLEILDMGRLDRFDSDVLSLLVNLRSLAVETYPNIEKYRFRLGGVLSAIGHLEELRVQIKEPVLSDQLFGGILPKLRKITVFGANLKKIEHGAFEGLQNCFHMDLTITETGVDDIPSRVFELMQNAEWARLDISNNKMSSLDSSALYPNRSVWFSKGTKLLQGGLILDGNEWICDCDLVWIGEWLRRWLRESFESHSTAIPLVHSMYEEIRRPTCIDPKGGGKIIPLIELYSDVMCHASALSKASSSSVMKILHFSSPSPTSATRAATTGILGVALALLAGLFTIDNLLRLALLLVAPLSSSALPSLLFTSLSSWWWSSSASAVEGRRVTPLQVEVEPPPSPSSQHKLPGEDEVPHSQPSS